MRQSTFRRLFGVALGVCIVTVFGAPNAAHAQGYCFQDLTPTFAYYYGCEEGAASTAGVGQSLQGIGEGFVQQQLSTVPVGASPTGRLRHTDHDGMRDTAGAGRRLGFEVDEGSVFANVQYDLPGTYFGGRVRVNGLVGYGWMDQKGDTVRDLAGNLLPGVQTFSADIDSVFYGGSYMWSQGSFYTMSMIIGVSGDVDGVGVGGLSYSHDLSGYFTNSVVGYTFQLPGAYKFDLRGALGHYDVSSDWYDAPDDAGGRIKSSSEAWSGSITGTLFTLVEVEGGVMRPYILGSYKNVFDEDIKVKGDLFASFEQATDFGKVELGFDYVAGMMTYGAAVYTEFSADESTVGARLGASIKLQ